MPRAMALSDLFPKYGTVVKDIIWSQKNEIVVLKAISTDNSFPPGCVFSWSIYDRTTGQWFDVPGNKPEVSHSFDVSINGEAHCIITKDNNYLDSAIVFFDYLCISRIKYVMHGGFSGEAPENTLPAFQLAKGAWGCEADTQVTKDGVWVMIHDEKVDDLTDGKGYVRNMTLEEIKALNVTHGVNIDNYPNLKIPTLDEYLSVVIGAEMVPVIEIKKARYTNENYEDLIGLIRKHQCEDYAVIISFEQKLLKEIRQFDPTIKMQAIVQWIDFVSKGRAKSIGNCGLDANVLFVNAAQIAGAHADDLEVNIWTVQNRSRAIKTVQNRADYITSSYKLYNYSSTGKYEVDPAEISISSGKRNTA